MIAQRIAWLIAALVLTGSADLFGQEVPPVAPGDRVRVSAPSIYRGELVGTVSALRSDSLVLKGESPTGQPHALLDEDATLAIALSSITAMEVSRQRSAMWATAGIGALLGAVAGAAIGAAVTEEDCTGFGEICSKELSAIAGAVPGALLGFGIGAAIGSGIRSQSWETVPLDRIRVSLTPRGGGLEVSAKFVF